MKRRTFQMRGAMIQSHETANTSVVGEEWFPFGSVKGDAVRRALDEKAQKLCVLRGDQFGRAWARKHAENKRTTFMALDTNGIRLHISSDDYLHVVVGWVAVFRKAP